MTPAFSPALYPLWCRAWLHVQNHQRLLVDMLGRTSQGTSANYVTIAQLAPALRKLLSSANLAPSSEPVLSGLYACLAAMEAAHKQIRPSDLRYQYPEAQAHGARHVLLMPGRQSVRRAYPEAGRFKLDGELGLDGALGLDYRWVRLQQEDILDWGHSAALDRLQAQPGLRVGIAPCAGKKDMRWQLDDADRRAPDGRAPLLCLGSGDAKAHWTVLEAVLRAAYDAEVQVLLFPELVLDDAALQSVRDWLLRHNLHAPRLRLVVAGSRHCVEGGEFRNRCTVLGLDGRMLWEQDKRTPFVIDDPQTLQAIKPGCTAGKAFEPTLPGYTVALRESMAGRLLTPICLDFIDDPLWAELGADIFLVPAMSAGLSRFHATAKQLGGRHGAASFVCNAATTGEHRLVDYLPLRNAPSANPVPGSELFTIDVNIVCNN